MIICLSMSFSIDYLNSSLSGSVAYFKMSMGSLWKLVIEKYLLLRISLI